MASYEEETKLRLEKEDFEHLLEAGEVIDANDHLNIYFDDSEELSSSSATFRIRFYSSRAPVMTLKVPQDTGSDARTCLEVEVTLQNGNSWPKVFDVDGDLPDQFSRPLQSLGVDRLHRLGYMRTFRAHVKIAEGIQIELDRVSLPNGEVFFEAEFESDDREQHQRAKELICSLAESARESRLSKYQRFSRAINDYSKNGSLSVTSK
jgi:uncharacterized protein YjbK